MRAAERSARPGYVVGVVHYRSYEDLEACLPAAKRQTAPPEAVVVLDADPDPERSESVRLRHPGTVWMPRPNLGYAAAANRILDAVASLAPRSDFVLLLNADVVLEPGFAEELLRVVQPEADVALASGKLLRRDRRTIDSAGIVLPRHRRPRDRGSEEIDRGQYEAVEDVFAVTGAALLIRRAALPSLALDGEVFDEDFFLYHEDTDLAWRAHRLGWRVLYVPGARAVHARGWKRSERFRIDPSVRRHSFKNHYLELIKNERLRDLLLNLPWLAAWELARLGYALLRDRALLAGYREAWALAPRALHRRRLLAARLREASGPAPPS